MTSETAFTPPKFQKRTLKGHHNAVLCLAHSTERLPYISKSKASADGNGAAHHHHPSLLLSGSEDGTARLWDLRTRKTAYCIVIPKEEGELSEVTSVAFHPSILECDESNKADLTVEQSNNSILEGKRDCTVYVGASKHVYGYDLRFHASQLTNTTSTSSCTDPNPIIRSPHFNLSSQFQCTDEVNQLSFSYPKHNESSKEYFVSAACDSGDVHICQNIAFKYTQQTLPEQNPKILHHATPESQAIASCSSFRPRVNDLQLSSCGTDCTVKLWDVKKPRKPICTVQIEPQEDNHNSSQLCNPPYVHSTAWSPSGKYLAAGLGDGSLLILSAEGRRLAEVGRLGWDVGGHKASVAAVCFPCFRLMKDVSRKAMIHGVVDDRLMVSAGNDGNINFWDLGRDMIAGEAADPATYLSSKRDEECSEVEDVTERLNSAGIDSSKDDIPDDLLPSPPQILFQIPHQNKANWLCSKPSDATLPCSLLVADTTKNISMYSLIL